jgi:hypothetical protein
MRIILLSVTLVLFTLSLHGQEKSKMRTRFLEMINSNFDSLGKIDAEAFAHVLAIDGNVVPLIYTGKFPVTLTSALRKDTPFEQMKFVEFIQTNDTAHDTLWHTWTKLWTKHYEDSTHTAKVRKVEVGEALSSYIAVHKLNGKPVNVIARNLANPQSLKKFIDLTMINRDEMVVVYYETEHGFYISYKRL